MTQLGCRPDSGGDRTPPFLEAPAPDPVAAAVHLLPVPMEATVSYGGGTARGPRAILEASFQLELYDREFDCEPGVLYGVHTHPEMELDSEPATAITQIKERVAQVYTPGKLLGVLGGEHSLTNGVVQGLLEREVGPLTIVQVDAHSDLRDSYEDSPYSHASVSRRLLELDGVENILQLGVRSLCPEEAAIIRENPRVRTWFAEEVHEGNWRGELARWVAGKRLYVTLDVDGLDPSLIPATGTPEPDGLKFHQVEQILRILAENAEPIAFDCVELAPIEGFHSPDFVVAKLVYRCMNLFMANKIKELKGCE